MIIDVGIISLHKNDERPILQRAALGPFSAAIITDQAHLAFGEVASVCASFSVAAPFSPVASLSPPQAASDKRVARKRSHMNNSRRTKAFIIAPFVIVDPFIVGIASHLQVIDRPPVYQMRIRTAMAMGWVTQACGRPARFWKPARSSLLKIETPAQGFQIYIAQHFFGYVGKRHLTFRSKLIIRQANFAHRPTKPAAEAHNAADDF